MEKYLVVVNNMIIDAPYDSLDTAVKFCNTEIDNDTDPHKITIYKITDVYEPKMNYSWKSRK